MDKPNEELSLEQLEDSFQLLCVGKVNEKWRKLHDCMQKNDTNLEYLDIIVAEAVGGKRLTQELWDKTCEEVAINLGDNEPAARDYMLLYMLRSNAQSLANSLYYLSLAKDWSDERKSGLNAQVVEYTEQILDFVRMLSESSPLVCNVAVDAYLDNLKQQLGISDNQLDGRY